MIDHQKSSHKHVNVLSKTVAECRRVSAPWISLMVSTDKHAKLTRSSKAFGWEAKEARAEPD